VIRNTLKLLGMWAWINGHSRIPAVARERAPEPPLVVERNPAC
jgi:hypothetical protein